MYRHTNSFTSAARAIRKTFDARYEPMWQCVIGKQFDSSIACLEEHYIRFRLGEVTVLLFNSG